ncbi:hypothetical protein PFAG_04446 [Plasmodium falciparum Santa Lucia]|uniref:Uncharacterized protein n=3 Tax=Plasmodium falciparum TaxID=5833 RepID=A0A024W1S6_PLAFA|nr:hypothetical protein PFTANZ_04407 [Plasmodium falciparum Tanzania (2000708)]ETW40967.1 hypothetical protein PFNF135_04605 [Plasmodium falciparum NF135/5.C10]EUT81229.1 hypothetical protein PFAG_04446 [Plasmodium falciparum Santa Lucia]
MINEHNIIYVYNIGFKKYIYFFEIEKNKNKKRKKEKSIKVRYFYNIYNKTYENSWDIKKRKK